MTDEEKWAHLVGFNDEMDAFVGLADRAFDHIEALQSAGEDLKTARERVDRMVMIAAEWRIDRSDYRSRSGKEGPIDSPE